MSQYITMADDIRSTYKDGDIDTHIEKYASDKGLNNNEKQRLVEEVNVGTFLDKLKDGSHYEDFPIANSVITHSDGESPVLESGELNKAASVDYSEAVSPNMFSFGLDNELADPMFEKTASINTIDGHIFNAEDKWEEAEVARDELALDEEAGLEKTSAEDEAYYLLGRLVSSANMSEGITKTAAIILAKNDLDDLAVSFIENSKFSSMDISESTAEPLTKEASDSMNNLLAKTSGLIKNLGNAAVGLKNVAMFPVKHPIVAAGTVGGGMYLNSKRMDRPDKERMKMSLRSFKNEQQY